MGKQFLVLNSLIFGTIVLLSNPANAQQQIQPDSVTIARDKWGVPHIFAKTDPEVAYGLAWAHAEDDFKTIQLTLLAGKGMLGQLKGKEGAEVDYVVALLRARELAIARYNTDLSADYKRLLEGYVQGLNDYARTHPREVLVKKSFPITPQDHVATAVLSLSIVSGADDVLKAIFSGETPPVALQKVGGSNGIAIHSSKTTEGKTYLAINSHQPLEGPVAWYEAHVASEEGWNILGGLFPGSPVINHGCNPNLAWAHTINYQDKFDVYELEINPANPLQYKFDGKWETLEEKEVKLKVKLFSALKISVKKKVYWSRYGATVKTDKGAFSIAMTANQDIRGTEQWYRMNKAQNFTEFKKSLEMLALPGFSIVYADRYDTIFYISNGKLPLRDPAYQWTSTLPGNTSRTLWKEYHPFKALPQLVNPRSGYLYNMNHTPFNATASADNLKAKDFDPTMGFETYNNNRSKRFMELIKQYKKLSYEDFKRIKYDVQLPAKMVYATDITAIFDLNPADYPDLRQAIEKAKHWNHRGDVNNCDVLIPLLVYIRESELLAAGKITYQSRKISREECISALRYAQAYLLKHFGSLDVKLGDYQKLVRGNIEMPMFGIPDVISAISSRPYKDGKVQAYQGESYIELVKFSKDGPEIESIVPYGASNHPDSPHYADQMKLYVQQKTKPMTLDKATILKEAERIYHPR
ncbi:MAG: penicillin acylase family protein [Bacteroidota bacterium]